VTFKAYTTTVMNKLRFVSQGRVRTAVRRCGQFCCSFVATLGLLKYLYPKIMQILWGLTKLLLKCVQVAVLSQRGRAMLRICL